jgi:type 1 glutamine amidotransferase
MKRREMLARTGAAVLGLSTLPFGRAAAAEKKRQRVLYFTRSAGFEHGAVKRNGDRLSFSERALIEMGKRAGFEVECTKDGRVFDGELDQYDCIAFYTSGDLTRPNQRNTPPMTPQGKKRLLAAIAAGKGFVGFHSATDSFHSKGPRNEIQTELDPYIAMLGGEFVTHGDQQEAALSITSGGFPGLRDLGCAEGLTFTEEWYALKNFAKDLHVILVQETKRMKGDCYQRPPFPATWARMHGKGRVFYTSFGHREDIWTNPMVQAIILGGVAWAMGNVDFDVKPNIDQVASKANQLEY